MLLLQLLGYLDIQRHLTIKIQVQYIQQSIVQHMLSVEMVRFYMAKDQQTQLMNLLIWFLYIQRFDIVPLYSEQEK